MVIENCAIYQNNEWTFHKNKKVELVAQIQLNIYQINTKRKDLCWIKSNYEPTLREEEILYDNHQSYISIFVAYLTFPCSS